MSDNVAICPASERGSLLMEVQRNLCRGRILGGENLIVQPCDAYVIHGDSPDHIATEVADMRERRDRYGLPPMQFGLSGYAFTRNTEGEVKREIERITNVKQDARVYENYQQWLQGTQLEQTMSI